MIKRIALLAAIAMPAFAGSETPKIWKNEFSIGGEMQHYHYKEPDIHQDFERMRFTGWMDLKGILFGINGSYRLTYKDLLFVQPEGRVLIGREAYRYGESNVGVVIKTHRDIPDLIVEPRLLAGGNIPISESLKVSPYTGIGYRLKIDDMEQAIGSSQDHVFNGRVIGFYRKSNYVYIPLGVEVRYQVSDTWSVSTRGEYDYFVKGWNYTRSEKKVIPHPTVTNKQKGTHGLKGEITVGYQLEKIKLSLTPYCYYWHIGNSNWVKKAQEPYNRTIETGLRFGVTF